MPKHGTPDGEKLQAPVRAGYRFHKRQIKFVVQQAEFIPYTVQRTVLAEGMVPDFRRRGVGREAIRGDDGSNLEESFVPYVDLLAAMIICNVKVVSFAQLLVFSRIIVR